MTKPFVQSYKYDSLYRITEAKEMNDTQQTWIQTYDYDRYGNRTAFSQNVDGQNLAINGVTLPTVDANTNRFNANQGYEYDKIGNLKKDITLTETRDIKFNGANKQIEVKNATTGYKIGEYFYDGSGKRVKKRLFDTNGVAKEDVIFIYSGDKLVAEYSTLPPPTNPTTKYVATDTLGSIRAMTNEYGEVVSRRDFMPFGEELQPDATYRKTNLKYNPDDVRQKFTGYQKDEETGLDFAEARMYNNAHARFTAVDPLMASGKSANPQTFNRYVYVMNSPMQYVDPDGLQASTKPKTKDDKKISPPKVKIKDNDKNSAIVQIRSYANKPLAFNGDPVLDGNGKVIKENGRTFKKKYGIAVRVSYQAVFAQGGERPDENTNVVMSEEVTETLDGEEGSGESRSVPLTDNEDGNSYYGGDLVGLTTESPKGVSTRIYKAEQKLYLEYTVKGKKKKVLVRTNNIEINTKKNTINITETTPVEDDEEFSQ